MISIQDLPTTEISIGSKKYPKQLLDLEDPPEMLHVRGHFNINIFENTLAIVGSRDMTPYGARVTDWLVKRLVPHGISTISGFMYGVDTRVHTTTLAVGGTTIAVLAHGLNHLYPTENKKLYTDIIQSKGCLISEYPNEFKPEAWTFPKRNRIVAALAGLGTVIVEAQEQSGSLITAQYADALNRPLFAIPGPVSSITSRGTNRLIKDRIAEMVLSPEEVLRVG